MGYNPNMREYEPAYENATSLYSPEPEEIHVSTSPSLKNHQLPSPMISLSCWEICYDSRCTVDQFRQPSSVFSFAVMIRGRWSSRAGKQSEKTRGKKNIRG
ncbi:hypothetical protein NC653_032572 [Populus alba x Populus x berolinensis]|uniref:Uncharacterized protein n=1 Tax=Populus alba x Populus x berolinensis TaxID=444605 RepID=A0AAD6LRQ1_9ROSI|nr:hypothetical protein NC653_032572 [Populus alba x Populus x berolinensis]